MRLRFYALCGMNYDVLEKASWEACQEAVKRWIKRHERADGGPITELVEGREWELADNGNSIGDRDGVLKILDEPEVEAEEEEVEEVEVEVAEDLVND